jgi:hypothetical protein
VDHRDRAVTRNGGETCAAVLPQTDAPRRSAIRPPGQRRWAGYLEGLGGVLPGSNFDPMDGESRSDAVTILSGGQYQNITGGVSERYRQAAGFEAAKAETEGLHACQARRSRAGGKGRGLFVAQAAWKAILQKNLPSKPRMQRLAPSFRTRCKNRPTPLSTDLDLPPRTAVAGRNLPVSASLPASGLHLPAVISPREDARSPEQASSGRVSSPPRAGGAGLQFPRPPVRYRNG